MVLWGRVCDESRLRLLRPPKTNPSSRLPSTSLFYSVPLRRHLSSSPLHPPTLFITPPISPALLPISSSSSVYQSPSLSFSISSLSLLPSISLSLSLLSRPLSRLYSSTLSSTSWPQPGFRLRRSAAASGSLKPAGSPPCSSWRTVWGKTKRCKRYVWNPNVSFCLCTFILLISYVPTEVSSRPSQWISTFVYAIYMHFI